MAMPKAAVNKDDGFAWAKDKIGTTGQVFYMKTVSIPHGMHNSADDHFWPRVFALDAAHYY
jgi:hypothetical protein